MEKINWRDYFYYDETSPSGLRWDINIYAGAAYTTPLVAKGEVAGCKKKTGHQYRWVVGLLNNEYKVHRVIYEMFHDTVLTNKCVIDHLNGDSSDNTVTNLRVVDQSVNRRNTRPNTRNTSGVTGVSVSFNKSGRVGFRARTQSLSGKEQSRFFDIAKLGIMVAFRDAVIHRQKMIEELNTQGAGYTERHGKENPDETNHRRK